MNCSARCLVTVASIGVILCFGLIGILLIWGGHWLQAPASTPASADAIVILGGDDDGERASRGLELYRAGYAPNAILTGLEIGRYAAPATSNWRVGMLKASGLPAESILLERRAANSYQEATNVLSLMKARGWHSVLVVSDPPHMRRLAWTWGRVFRGSGNRFTLIASNPQWWNADRWWTDERAGAFAISEFIKLVYYLAKYEIWHR